MTNPLTLLVFLKDRADFTKRFIDYLSFIQYPFHVLFADGSLEDENEKIFKSLGNVNFSYEYIRYPKDQTINHYYQKCVLAIEKVKTPYVMLVDNDDFPIVEGQSEAINFLEKNQDYIGCNGRVGGVMVSPNAQSPYGKWSLYLPLYCYSMDVKVLLDEDDPIKRIRSYLNNFYSIFYSVYRTKNLKSCFKEVLSLNFSDLGIYELFFSYIQLAQGKIHTINTLTYIRQKGSSQAAASQKDWFHRLFYTNWLEDLKAAIQNVAHFIALKEGKNVQDVYELLYADFVARQRTRFMPTNFYFYANSHLFFKIEYIANLILNKVFKLFPWLGEFIGFYSLSKFTAKNNLLNIRKIIHSKGGGMKA